MVAFTIIGVVIVAVVLLLLLLYAYDRIAASYNEYSRLRKALYEYNHKCNMQVFRSYLASFGYYCKVGEEMDAFDKMAVELYKFRKKEMEKEEENKDERT